MTAHRSQSINSPPTDASRERVAATQLGPKWLGLVQNKNIRRWWWWAHDRMRDVTGGVMGRSRERERRVSRLAEVHSLRGFWWWASL